MTFPARSILLVLAAGCGASAPARPQRPAPGAGASLCTATIARTWHGKVPAARSEEYTAYISEAITKFRGIQGNRGYQLMRETIGEETHFTVISYWDARASIQGYAGADIRKTHNLPRDPEFLIDLEPTVKNYDLVVQSLDCPAAR